MTLLSQTIKNFVQGVSQQPPILRFPEQLEEQVNGFSTETDGLQKRVPSVHVSTLNNLGITAGGKPLIHWINKDNASQYMVVFANNTIQIYDVKGNKKTVNINSDAAAYLQTTEPRNTLRVLTIADYTFVVNNTVKVAMSSEKSPDYFASQGSMLYVKQGQYGRTYRVWIDGVQKAEFTTPDGSTSADTQKIDTTYIADQINSQLNTNGVSTDHTNNWIRIKSDGLVQTADGFNNQALIHFKKSIQRFNLLPATAPSNYCVKVKGDPNGDDSGSYYIKYNETDAVWEECPCPNVNISFNASTMPHAIVHNADDTFTFKCLDWDKRDVGDDDSNPYPSFVDNTLSSIFFFRNRLGVTSKENVIMTESGNYWNWWMTTANDLLDTDGIDISVSSTKSNIINYVVTYSEDLYAFSNDTQFILRVDSVLTPKSASFAEITEFNSSPLCQPKVAGKNMYFPSEHGNYVSLQEYYTVQQISDAKDAQDVTAHVPNYINAGVYEIIPSTAKNVLFVLTNGATDTLFIYKYLFSEQSRVQSSWSKWTFTDCELFGATFMGSILYVLIRRGNNMSLEYFDFSVNIIDLTSEKYRVYLDQKKQLNTGVFDDVSQQTTFDIRSAYGFKDDTPFKNVGVVDSVGQFYLNQIVTDGKITLYGDYSNKYIVVGTQYAFKAVFTPFYLKSNNNGSVTAQTTGRTQIRYLEMHYSHSGYFEVHVALKGGQEYVYKMTGSTLGDYDTILGDVRDVTGKFNVPVHAQNTDATIYLYSDMPVPMAITGMTWLSNYLNRAKEV